MKHRLLLGATVGLALAALGSGTSGAAPPDPVIAATCGSTGFVQVTWQHAKLSEIDLDWSGTDASGAPADITKMDAVLSPKPKGYLSDSPGSPGFTPTSVTVTSTNTDGSTNDPVTVDCF